MKGELHLPGHNYTGPGTRTYERIARGDQPYNKIDALALQHDIMYLEARGAADRITLVNQADEVMYTGALDIAFGRRDSTVRERIDALIVAPILMLQQSVRSVTGMDFQTVMGWHK